MNPNNESHFFKYLGFYGAIKTLQEKQIRLSSIKLLNDPFDTKFCLRPVISGDDCCEIMGNHIYDAIQTQQAPKLPKGVSEDLKLRLIQKLSFSTKDQLMEVLRKGNIISLYEQHIDVLDKTSRALLDINYIYCLTEDPANLLMWSHYAEKHQGVVLKFKCIKQMDNIFLAAQKVQYKKTFPSYGTKDCWRKLLTEDIPIDAKNLYRDVVTTKSEEWGYEKEWRVILPLLNYKADYHHIKIFPEEVESVYLGCCMSDLNKKNLIDIIQKNYPSTKILQMEKSKTSFSLDITQVA